MDPKNLAEDLISDLESLPVLRTAPMRAVRRSYSKRLATEDAETIYQVASTILEKHKHHWIAYELVRYHPKCYQSLNATRLEKLGRGINSWGTVDSFARTLSGPAWRDGLIPSATIFKWTHSDDRWWRRAALVSTVALNVRSRGGVGDVDNTLAVCEMLVEDRDDMVVKAHSWALRELVVHDPDAVEKFLTTHDEYLHARVKREVRNKLETGLKNPKAVN